MLDDGQEWGAPGMNNDPAGSVSEDALIGKELYDTYCAVCHGPEGTGAAVWPGSIQGIDPINDIVRNGRRSMLLVPLDDGQIAAIQAYLNSFGTDLSLLTGAEIYASQCATCHGDSGEGALDGPVIQFAYRDYGNWVIRNGRDGAGYPSAMPSYPASRVTEQQLQEIVDFLHEQRRPSTGQGLYTTFCSHCHGYQGLGGVTGKIVAGHRDVAEVIRVGKGGNAYGSRSLYMPGWGNGISSEEIGLVSNYVGSMPEP
jgi:mono/diheme cytochrome c family protein